MSEKLHINRLAEAADLQTELLPNQSLIEIFGDCRLLIECHKGILRYSNEEIIVSLKRGLAVVSGEKLSVALMNRNRLVICGLIRSVELKKEIVR